MGNWYDTEPNCFVYPGVASVGGSPETVRIKIEWSHPVGVKRNPLNGRAWLRPIKSGKRRRK